MLFNPSVFALAVSGCIATVYTLYLRVAHDICGGVLFFAHFVGAKLTILDIYESSMKQQGEIKTVR